MWDRIKSIRDMAYKKLGRKCIRLMLLIMGMTVLMCILIKISRSPSLMQGNRLPRGDIGEGDTVYSLVCTDEETGDETQRSITVSERRCNEGEIDEYFADAYIRLEKQVLNGNESLEKVTTDLNLTDRIEGTPITVEWLDLDKSFLYADGSLKKEELTEDELVCLTARLTYFDEVRIYSFYVKLVPKETVRGSDYEEKFDELIKEADIRTIKDEWMELPDSIDGRGIEWAEQKDNSCATMAVLGIIATAAVPLAQGAEQKKKEKSRRSEMLKDYPDIISKFILLITAGMTCRGAWTKICGDYKDKSDKRRAAYEEMQVTLEELELGRPEASAYEEFGRRCNVYAYQRFGTLLANNLKRGSRDILGLLEMESREAFENRKEEVQKRAEEAETKLLGPMVGMLGIVIAIVVVPAFAAFG